LEDETFSHSLIASQTFEEFMEIFMNYL
jgi:hypothetical protein